MHEMAWPLAVAVPMQLQIGTLVAADMEWGQMFPWKIRGSR
jgi:hypothetical protein